MLQIESTFFELGESCEQDCLIICDRGAMDAAACKYNSFYLCIIYYTIIAIISVSWPLSHALHVLNI